MRRRADRARHLGASRRALLILCRIADGSRDDRVCLSLRVGFPLFLWVPADSNDRFAEMSGRSLLAKS